MIRYENECVGCPEDMGCLGSVCPYIKVPRLYCDECGNEEDTLYSYHDKAFCAECFLERYEYKIRE